MYYYNYATIRKRIYRLCTVNCKLETVMILITSAFLVTESKLQRFCLIKYNTFGLTVYY